MAALDRRLAEADVQVAAVVAASVGAAVAAAAVVAVVVVAAADDDEANHMTDAFTPQAQMKTQSSFEVTMRISSRF